MSFVRARRLTDVCTVWPRDASQQFPTFGQPYTLQCNFISGGKLQRDSNGDEFVPDATFRLQFDSREGFEALGLKRDDVILQGDFEDVETPDSTGQSTANKIRKVKTGTMLTGLYDVTVYTG
jgi:hypothetical protein